MGLADAFNVLLHVPALRGEEVARVLAQEGAFAEGDIPAVRLELGGPGWRGGGGCCFPSPLPRRRGGPGGNGDACTPQLGRPRASRGWCGLRSTLP